LSWKWRFWRYHLILRLLFYNFLVHYLNDLGLRRWRLSPENIFLYPRVISQLFHSNPFFSIDLQTIFQYINTTLTYSLFNKGIYFIAAALNGLNNFVIITTLERELTVKHTVQNYPWCPYVYSTIYFIVFLIVKAFRRHIREAPCI
jgi:hypothetical protein